MKEAQQSHGPVCTVLESNSINSVLEHANVGDTLVIFDIDNTLLHTKQELGSDAWAFWVVQQKIRQGLPPHQALEYMFDLFKHIHTHIDIYPVEDHAVTVLQQLKERSIPTICLTGRPGPLIDQTIEQLRKTGLVLNCPDTLDKAMTLKLQHKAEMSNGVICGGINDKGHVMSTVFQELGYQTPHIVFVDDKQSCVDSIGKACSTGNIGYTGLRYGYLDHIAAKFDAQKAEEQLETFLRKHAFSR